MNPDRKSYIGGSEVAALFGLPSFGKTRFSLYHEKKGLLPPVEESERMEAGRFMEPAIASWWSERNGIGLRETRYTAHPTIARMGGTPDRWTDDNNFLSIKTVDYSVFKSWEGEIPINYLLQYQHYLACDPAVKGVYFAICVGGNRLLTPDDMPLYYERRPATIEKIETAVKNFWIDFDADRVPQPDFAADADALAALYATKTDEVLDLSSNNRLPILIDEYQSIGKEISSKQKERDALRAEMDSIFGSAKVIMTGDKIINFSFVKGGTYERKDGYRINIKDRKSA